MHAKSRSNKFCSFASDLRIGNPDMATILLVHCREHFFETILQDLAWNQKSTGEFIGLPLEIIFPTVVLIQPVKEVFVRLQGRSLKGFAVEEQMT